MPTIFPCFRKTRVTEGWRVLAAWDSQGLLDDVENALGYRFRLISSSIPSFGEQGEAVSLNLMMANDGSARPFNPRDMEIILRNQSTLQDYSFDVALGDTRLFLPGAGETKTLNLSFVLTTGMALGDYDLFLNLPDPEVTLAGIADYSINLANENLWESTAGYNSLQATITVQAVPEPSRWALFLIGVLGLLFFCRISWLRESSLSGCVTNE